ncbi:MAG TPA: hypothetical protein VIG68_03445 [Lysobacter sp.]
MIFDGGRYTLSAPGQGTRVQAADSMHATGLMRQSAIEAFACGSRRAATLAAVAPQQ